MAEVPKKGGEGGKENRNGERGGFFFQHGKERRKRERGAKCRTPARHYLTMTILHTVLLERKEQGTPTKHVRFYPAASGGRGEGRDGVRAFPSRQKRGRTITAVLDRRSRTEGRKKPRLARIFSRAWKKSRSKGKRGRE